MYWISNPNYTTMNEFLPWMDSFLEYVKSTDSSAQWIDVGCHKGIITDIMAQHDPSAIWSFEPHQGLYRNLVNKYKNNSNITVWPLAVGDYVHNTEFFASKIEGSSASYIKASPNKIDPAEFESTPMTVVTLDSFSYPNRVSFIKIDAEGHDFLVIKGAEKLIKKDRPYIIFEFSGRIECDIHNYTPAEWYKFFKDNNYHLRVPVNGMDDKYVIKNFNSPAPELFNLIAVPNETPLPI